MTTQRDLEPLVLAPREDLATEYKSWIDLTSEHGKATLAKAAIALANHGGGFVVIGFEERNQNLVSLICPAGLPPITQDLVNSVIRRYAEPEFHCQVLNVAHPSTSQTHTVIVVPSTLTVPVISRRDYQKVIAQNRCYIRKPGPRSEEPQTSEEWRTLFNRCVRTNRNELLDAIRAIVMGSVEPRRPTIDSSGELEDYCGDSYNRWKELSSQMIPSSPARFPYGCYEIGLSLTNAESANGIVELRRRLQEANKIHLTGWPIFLEPSSGPKAHGDFIEAWQAPEILNVFNDASHCDFWRASIDGKLYAIRGYAEDDPYYSLTGKVIDVTLPIWRIGEGLLFASRFADTFEKVDGITVRCHFRGLRGRMLHSLSGRYFVSYGYNNFVNQMSEFTVSGQYALEQVKNNLAEVLHALLASFYQNFNFFDLPIETVRNELIRMQKNRF